MTTEVIPFRGLRYNQTLVPDLSLVVCPPYDIISLPEQRRYHEKHPDNAIHLDFGLKFSTDNDVNNRYTRAAALLEEWLAEKILVPEPAPALYFLREEFEAPDGSPTVREGFIAAVRLSDFSEGKILPHEETAPGPKEDRLRLIEATQANLSPIFCLYSDPGGSLVRQAKRYAGDPETSIRDEAGTRHTLWTLVDPDLVGAFSAALSQGSLLIADGHHRYETMLAYRDERRARERPDGDRPYDFTMVYLAGMDGDSRSVLPIHRFVSGLAGKASGALELLGADFDILDVPGTGEEQRRQMIGMMAETDAGRNAFGLYLAAEKNCHVLVGRRPRPMLPAADEHSKAFRSLDVAVLDKLILSRALDIRPGGVNQEARVSFVERTEAALDRINAGDTDLQIALFVNPTRMEEIKAVAAAGEKMPQKSTYFYPKPLTGLVFRGLKI